MKLVHRDYQVNHKTQKFWVKVVHLVPNVHTLAGHAIGTIDLALKATLHFDTIHKTKYLFPHWIFFLTKIGLEITNIKYMMWCTRWTTSIQKNWVL